jgi:uncharacterized alkaline shock family protein YloU
MSIALTNDLGTVQITDEVIATIAGSAALDCYGLVGMASQNQLKDGIAELLGRDNLARGVEVRRVDDEVHVDLYVIVSYGTRISEVAQSIQNRVKYVIDEVVGLHVDCVNIRVQGVRVI